MKWTGMYLIGYIVLIGGVLAALWKIGVLASIGMTWTVIGVVILTGSRHHDRSLPQRHQGKHRNRP